MIGGPPGFHNAPVSKALVIAVALFSIPFGFHGGFKNLGLSYQDIYGKLQVWRIITSVLAFSSSPELLFGVCLLYYFRVFEHQIGSSKYAVFIIFSVIVSLLLQILYLGYLKGFSMIRLASGPYSLVFASYVPFYFDIPVSSRLHIFGVRFSDKSFIYLAGLQLLFSSWKDSLVPGICGLLAGCLYRLNTFGIRRIKFPEIAASLASRIRWPFSSNSAQIFPHGVHGRNMLYETHQEEVIPPAAQEPLDSSLGTLVSMGFESNMAREILMHTGNDLTAATNILLEAQPRT